MQKRSRRFFFPMPHRTPHVRVANRSARHVPREQKKQRGELHRDGENHERSDASLKIKEDMSDFGYNSPFIARTSPVGCAMPAFRWLQSLELPDYLYNPIRKRICVTNGNTRGELATASCGMPLASSGLRA